MAIKFRKYFVDLKRHLFLRIDETPGNCPYCSRRFLADDLYCSRCGEKKPEERRNRFVIDAVFDFFSEITHFDNKFALTLMWLFFRPGLVTRAHFLGVKSKVLKSITILALSLTFFYQFFPNVTLFHTGFNEMAMAFQRKSWTTSNVFRFNIAKAAEKKSLAINKSVEEVIVATETRAQHYANIFLWILLPVWAFTIRGVLKEVRPYYIDHIIFAASLFGTYLLFWLLIALIIFGLKIDTSISPIATLWITLGFAVFTILSVKNAFLVDWSKAMLKGSAVAVSLFILVVLFRQLITIISFEMVRS